MRNSLIAAAALLFAAGPVTAQTPVPNAGAWQIAGPGEPPECTARMNGAQIDTMLTLNNDGRMVLMAGRADWNNPAATERATLQIDALRPRKVSGDYVANLFFVLVADDRMAKDLAGAHQLAWTLKLGKFQADVTGLGAALDAVRACKAKLAAPQTS